MMLASEHGSGVSVWRSEDGHYLFEEPEVRGRMNSNVFAVIGRRGRDRRFHLPRRERPHPPPGG